MFLSLFSLHQGSTIFFSGQITTPACKYIVNLSIEIILLLLKLCPSAIFAEIWKYLFSTFPIYVTKKTYMFFLFFG